mgnify:CR=1 FL=1
MSPADPSDGTRRSSTSSALTPARSAATSLGAPMILIHHIGARSGTERVNPLVYLPDGDDMIIAATKGGAPTNPDWYHNLKAHRAHNGRGGDRDLSRRGY